MLQNISSEYMDNKNINDTKEESINFKQLILKLFSIQNSVIYFLTFLISMVGLGQNNAMIIAPFGIALLAAAISNGVPIAILYLAGLIGTSIKFGTGTTLMYFLTSIILLLTVVIKKPVRNEEQVEQYKLGGYLFISVIIASIIKMAFSGVYLFDVLTSLTLGISTYVFYKIFVSSLTVIKSFEDRKIFSIEEVVGASLLIAVAVSAIGNFTIFSFSLRNIICIFIVLALGWRNGILVGGVSGTTVGIVLGIIGDGNPTLIASYAISGMIAGMLNRFGKIGVILGFIIGNIIIAYSANGGTQSMIMFQEILIASVGLLSLPKRVSISVEDILPKTKLLPEAVGKIEEGSNTFEKLNSISQTISEMSDNYQNTVSYEKSVADFEHEVLKAIDGMEDNLLYEYIYNNEGDLLKDILDFIIDNEVLTENGIISILAKHNIFIMNSDDKKTKGTELKDIRKMIKAINSAYNVCKSNAIWQKKMQEKDLNMSAQLNNVKDAIDDIAKDITDSEENVENFWAKEEKIKNKIKAEGIDIKRVSIQKEKTGRFIVNIITGICKDEDGTQCPIKKMKKHINNVLDDNVVLQSQECGLRAKKDKCEYKYISEDRFILKSGIAKIKKDKSIVSGDMISETKLGDGKYLFAISDGMGSGPNARKNSRIAVSMLERLLNSGFDKDTSINLINSAILTANQEEMYATLDIEILDLYAGKMQVLKNGACPTYVKKNKNVTMITSKSLPAGIVKDVKIDTYDKDLEDGNIIVICSDGIIESNSEYSNRELWIKYLLEEIQTDSPGRIADIILKEAIDNNFGKPKDDMSVIVTKVIKK